MYILYAIEQLEAELVYYQIKHPDELDEIEDIKYAMEYLKKCLKTDD